MLNEIYGQQSARPSKVKPSNKLQFFQNRKNSLDKKRPNFNKSNPAHLENHQHLALIPTPTRRQLKPSKI